MFILTLTYVNIIGCRFVYSGSKIGALLNLQTAAQNMTQYQ